MPRNEADTCARLVDPLMKIETGVIKKPSVFTVEQIASALDVSADDLLQ